MPPKDKGNQPETKSFDLLTSQFSLLHSNPSNRLIHYISIPVVTFGLLGVIWAIPFPHVDLLGAYNGFVNWASFIIAFCIYYYYRLSAVTSYMVLLMVFAFSAGIVGLEKLHNQQGWPEMWLVCLVLFISGVVAQIAGHRAEPKRPSFSESLRSVLIGPMWLFDQLLSKAKRS